jgi:hypothetical protein
MIDNQDKTFEVLKHDLSRYLPIRIVLRKTDDGLEGLCEDSFSMSFSKYNVRIWWSGKAYSILGEHNINGIDDANHNAKPGDLILDPLSEDCPVTIDWRRWKDATTKYNKRNAMFTVKETQ